MIVDISKLTDTQKRALAEASRVVSIVDGIPLPSAQESIVKDPARLKNHAARVLDLAETLERAADELAPRQKLDTEPDADTAA